MEQMSTKEIAHIIDKSHGATRVMLHRAVDMLKNIAENYEKKHGIVAKN